MKMPRIAAAARVTIIGLGLLVSHAVLATQADLDGEVDGILADLEGRSVPINLLAKRIKWSGITEHRLFDAVEAELLANYQVARSIDGVQRVSWLVQFLAFSGVDKYRTTIEKVAAGAREATLKRHAESSRLALEDFKRWNPIIAKGLETVPTERIPKQRVINMLQGSDWPLVRSGASFVFDLYLQDAEMIGIITQRLNFLYPRIGSDLEAAEAAAWMIKVLGETRDRSHIPLLETLAKSAEQPAVERWAVKSLNKLKGVKPRPGGPSW